MPPPADTAVKELTSTAPGKTADDTFTFGVFEDEKLYRANAASDRRWRARYAARRAIARS